MTGLDDVMRAVCARHGVEFVAIPDDATAGIADNVVAGAYPLNGLRHRRGTASGWFIWAGHEPGRCNDFFKPRHVRHLHASCPEVLPMLGLPEGWRFLIARGYEDVWFDEQLLSHEA